jgi:hypothetical protein
MALSGNEGALIGPIVSAVSSCVTPELTDRGLALIEAFDRIPLVSILQTMRGLDLFSEQSIGRYYSIAIRNKLWAILEPSVSKPAPAKRKPARTRSARSLHRSRLHNVRLGAGRKVQWLG